MNAVLDAPSLSALDRCDRCGAQAYVHVTLPGGSDLRFCGHHGRAFAPVLEAQGATVVDESDKLR
ncbi:MAG: hypothetical protein ACFCVG_14150 [Kineosporiaceae bacterium]